MKLVSSEQNIENLYQKFDAPISKIDCGKKCSPYNERGVPFCCDTKHVVPAVYEAEWSFYQGKTELWHLWAPEDNDLFQQMQADTPDGMLLAECLGHKYCQRDFRSMACRSFPFFPYITSKNEFVGLTYYWEYQDRCWVISNLETITDEFRVQFVKAYSHIFEIYPNEKITFASYSEQMRAIFAVEGRLISVLHRDGNFYKITPQSEQTNQIRGEQYEKYGPYEIAASLPFPDEK